MPTIDVKNTSGDTVGIIDLDDRVWAADVNEHLLWEVVKWQRAKRRAGTHSTRTVAEVRGGGKKPYRQKGTGRARQGSTRAPQFVGGGTVFGPHPRDYGYALPKKVRRGALRSALSLRLKEARVIVLDRFVLDHAKTREVASALKKLGAERALIVDTKENEALARGARNLARARWVAPEGLNVYDLLDHELLVITQDSAKKVEAALRPAAK
ncbi:MAG: 50S ribosomal protein L4 [Deltaproteobacteria bacterium]|nr:50S ribosomal protein L4 [Deltaproteobacteria bacterium]